MGMSQCRAWWGTYCGEAGVLIMIGRGLLDSSVGGEFSRSCVSSCADFGHNDSDGVSSRLGAVEGDGSEGVFSCSGGVGGDGSDGELDGVSSCSGVEQGIW